MALAVSSFSVPSVLVCRECGTSSIVAPDGSTIRTRFFCRVCCDRIARQKNITECQQFVAERRAHVLKLVEANRARRSLARLAMEESHSSQL